MRKAFAVVVSASVLAGVSLLVTACVAAQRSGRVAASPLTEPRPVATVAELMAALTIPSSDALFQIVSDTPATNEQWTAAKNSAIALAESGNLIMVGGRAKDNGSWMQKSLAMVDAAVAARKAAESRNLDALSAATDTIVETCTACHAEYLKN